MTAGSVGDVHGKATGALAPGKADPSTVAAQEAAGGELIEALMSPPTADGGACRGLHPDGSLVQDWEYFDNFFKRYNKVRRHSATAAGCCELCATAAPVPHNMRSSREGLWLLIVAHSSRHCSALHLLQR